MVTLVGAGAGRDAGRAGGTGIAAEAAGADVTVPFAAGEGGRDIITTIASAPPAASATGKAQRAPERRGGNWGSSVACWPLAPARVVDTTNPSLSMPVGGPA